MIIALCHISGVYPVEADRLKMLVRYLTAPLASIMWWRVLMPIGSKEVDDFAILIASFESTGVKDGIPVDGS